MFRSFHTRDRAGKSVKPTKKSSYREATKLKLQQKMDSHNPLPVSEATLNSPIVTLTVGHDQRLFAAHETVLSASSFFAVALKTQFFEATAKRLDLPDEDPIIFSCVLEYLYKGDYYPRLLHNRRKDSWELEDAQDNQNLGGRGSCEAVFIPVYGSGDAALLKDTAVYCLAEKFGLPELKRLALRKQGLQSGIGVDVILRSARYAYAHTPETDSKLRAHYLALIIRSRKTFKRSGTMQMEMEMGGSGLFFDLFVAMCNHVDDISDLKSVKGSPRSIHTA